MWPVMVVASSGGGDFGEGRDRPRRIWDAVEKLIRRRATSWPNQNSSCVGFVLGFMRRRSLALKTVGLRERDSIEEEARKSEIWQKRKNGKSKMKTKEPSDIEMKKHKLDESGPSNNINQWSILPIHTPTHS